MGKLESGILLVYIKLEGFLQLKENSFSLYHSYFTRCLLRLDEVKSEPFGDMEILSVLHQYTMSLLAQN